MKINTNIAALNAYRNLSANQFATSKNLEKLSSGLRINRAADDAAGLAISEKMRTQIRGLKQSERNSMDGISLMQTAEGALQEVHAMLQRMRELSVQASNDTNTEYDRQQIQKEVEQLKLEIGNVADKTEFNTRKLLNGDSAVMTNISQSIDNGANMKEIINNPKVYDSSLETGVYHAKVEDTSEIVKLNQVGAGISDSADISLDPDSEFFPQEFGEYRINVTNFLANEVAGETQHSARIQVMGPNGLPIEEKSVAVYEQGEEFSIGGLNIDTSKINSVGTIKASIEQEATFSVYRGDEVSDNNKIAAEKTMTTKNGIIKHGGVEFSFDNKISTPSAVGEFQLVTASDTGAIGAATMVEDTASIAAVASTATVEDAVGDTLTATNPTGTAVDITIQQAADDNLAVDGTGGSLTISLADTTPGNNTAANIEAAVQALGTVDGTDFSGWTFAAGGTWDTAATGATLTTATDTFSGGTEEQLGESTFSITEAFGASDQIVIGGVTITAANGGAGANEIDETASAEVQAAEIKSILDADGGFNAQYTVTDNSDGTLTIAEKVGQADGSTLAAVITGAGASTQGQYSFDLASNVEPDSIVTIGSVTLTEGVDFTAGADIEATATAIAAALGTEGTYTALADESTITITETTASGVDLTAADISISGIDGTTKFSITNNSLAFQIGPNTNQNVMIDVSSLDIETLGIKDVDLTTRDKANDAIFSLDEAINVLSDIRAKLGAMQNRMEHTINNLQVTHENLTAAESRIRDADMALEMTEFTRNNIVNQAATAMLAQANQLPQGVLQLLQ